MEPITSKPIVGPSGPGDQNEDDDDKESGDDESGPASTIPLNQVKEAEYDLSDQENDDEDLPQFPITHEITLKDHTKVVSGLALDPSGARIVSGSHDYDCKLWDFGGMDMRCKPFKSWEPAGTYHVRLVCYLAVWLVWTFSPQIHDVNFSNDGTKFLCISGTTQAKIFDRDGEEQYVCFLWV